MKSNPPIPPQKIQPEDIPTPPIINDPSEIPRPSSWYKTKKKLLDISPKMKSPKMNSPKNYEIESANIEEYSLLPILGIILFLLFGINNYLLLNKKSPKQKIIYPEAVIHSTKTKHKTLSHKKLHKSFMEGINNYFKQKSTRIREEEAIERNEAEDRLYQAAAKEEAAEARLYQAAAKEAAEEARLYQAAAKEEAAEEARLYQAAAKEAAASTYAPTGKTYNLNSLPNKLSNKNKFNTSNFKSTITSYGGGNRKKKKSKNKNKKKQSKKERKNKKSKRKPINDNYTDLNIVKPKTHIDLFKQNTIEQTQFRLLLPYFTNIITSNNIEKSKYYLKLILSIEKDTQNASDVVEYIYNIPVEQKKLLLVELITKYKFINIFSAIKIIYLTNHNIQQNTKQLDHTNKSIKFLKSSNNKIGGAFKYTSLKSKNITLPPDQKYLKILNEIINNNKTYIFYYRTISLYKIIIKSTILKLKIKLVSKYLKLNISNKFNGNTDIDKLIKHKFNYYEYLKMFSDNHLFNEI